MDSTVIALAAAVITLLLLVVAIVKLAALGKSVNRLADQIPGTSMTAKELATELGGSIESSFQKFMPQPDKVSGAISSSVEASVKSVLGQVEGIHKKLMDAQDAVLDKWVAHEKNTTSGLGAITKALEDNSKKFDEALKHHADKTAKATAELSAQLDKIATLGKEIDKLLHLQQATDGTIKAIASSEEFKKTLEGLRVHLEASDKLLREVAKPRTIRLVEQE
jgi:hypothetical protein